MAENAIKLAVTDLHTAGEPVRIVTGGYPELADGTILEKRRDALTNHDHLRRMLMLEPRGHPEMYGVIPVKPDYPGAALGVLFTHNSGYSTMCGHATIAIGRWAIESGIVEAVDPVTEFILQCPCGPVKVRSEVRNGQVGDVSFESVAGYVADENVAVDLDGIGTVPVDLIYGGAYYACVPAAHLKVDLWRDPLELARARALQITETLRATHQIKHPTEPDLGFLYGTIVTANDHVTPDRDNFHLCFLGTISSTEARLAVGLPHAWRSPMRAARLASERLALSPALQGLDSPVKLSWNRHLMARPLSLPG